jgi:hypothetical protein
MQISSRLLMMDRRSAVVGGVSILGADLVAPQSALATDVGEAIRQGATNLPGLGPTDVFYPTTFQGRWRAVRDTVVGENLSPMEYEMRFIASSRFNAVVADRCYNQAALETALYNQPVRICEWTQSNPNDLRVTLYSGEIKEVKITKRAYEATGDTVFSSEFARITSQKQPNGFPVVGAVRTLTKWKVVNADVLEGLEIIYDMGSVGDPLAGSLTTKDPQVVSKYRLHLERLRSS